MNQKLIFVVEDDTDIRDSLKEFLESEGYGVEDASNGQQAIDRLRASPFKPDLILLDLMMPVKDGFAFREEQLADPQISAIPIVVMSADGNVKEKQTKASAAEYLKKPVDLDDLLAVLERCA